ncbi:hypothetical protein FAM09_15680 [Niastella caeni]|uniref:Uncharacterized protein n=1 Tax=Niastella caeni TaxID=2569763 RepID=A0A4S8HRQ0_9BACT|nr:hypothetical protein [Niastella caeni]THU38123.1 hypothetical protein FAM09_15680 [Niastella caeni]
MKTMTELFQKSRSNRPWPKKIIRQPISASYCGTNPLQKFTSIYILFTWCLPPFLLFGYKNCEHEFDNGRCIKCFWNGKESEYIHKLKNRNLNKSKKIMHVLAFLQNKYGETNIIINDHWEADREAIGLTDKTGQYLAYISTISNIDNNYFVALENPSAYNEMPYSPAGDFDNISLTELEKILIPHLKLRD